MEINRQQYTPNFGMAVKIEKGAEGLLENAPSKVRQFFLDLGEKIEGSRNDVWICKDGTVKCTYEPGIEELSLAVDGQGKSSKVSDDVMRKKFKKVGTFGETVDYNLESIKTLCRIAKIKLFSFEHPLLKKGRIAAEWQQLGDKFDALDARIEQRLKAREAAAKAETEQLMQRYGKE